MKKIILIIFLVTSKVNAQKESLSLAFGKPWFADSDIISMNYSMGIQYQNRFSQSFAYQIVLQFAQNNSLPAILNSQQTLDEFIFSQSRDNIIQSTLWSKIHTFSLGGEISYMFVNNDRFLFEFNFGLGYFFSRSSSFELEQYAYDSSLGQITAYESSIAVGTMNTTYYSLGIQFHYTFYKDYFIGLNPKYQAPIDGDKFFQTIPVYPNNYNITLTLGKRF